MEQQAILAIGIFLLTYALIISEKIHRTLLAMAGAVLMIMLGIIDQESAIHHIDFNTLGLLIGMMIIVNTTAETGVFNYIGIWTAKRAKGNPLTILWLLALITAVGSAFLDNVTTIILMVPVAFSITRHLKVKPFPYVFSLIIASNIGGTATLIGDPPNIMIGSAVQELTFMAFLQNLAPVTILILAGTLPLLLLIFRRGLTASKENRESMMGMSLEGLISNRKLLIQCLVILGLTLLGFFLHQTLHLESATIALAGAFLLLLLTGEHVMEKAFRSVEWPTIFFFVGLFVLVGGLIETGTIKQLAERAIDLTGGDPLFTSMLILWLSAIASAFLDNIPFVATMIPMIQDMGNMGITNLEPLWWSLALGACLGGNGSLIGASANLIAAGMAAKEGESIPFLKFLKFGFPLMLLSIVICSAYILIRYF
ncbi:Na+/H+ antiporter NhaD/arsenite permease-like protein [Fontibacillus phaseoli]|uniref:Na+/H+ antiporter NhaD/arsenite permease-like protein n=1 Tax=Fontibacillus phaseoli TaxID=1416533 RepID=A0A369BGH5_9BACL|nr:ArsB/NhaD family transporter [Fontibacillus phaseoli]RCX19577.1 Na+/H+ antiporter NhaD/arsenite permease-like protein [Fontibacillus phaseoli]